MIKYTVKAPRSRCVTSRGPYINNSGYQGEFQKATLTPSHHHKSKNGKIQAPYRTNNNNILTTTIDQAIKLCHRFSYVRLNKDLRWAHHPPLQPPICNKSVKILLIWASENKSICPQMEHLPHLTQSSQTLTSSRWLSIWVVKIEAVRALSIWLSRKFPNNLAIARLHHKRTKV